MTWSLNIWGDTDDAQALADTVSVFVEGIKGLGGGTFNAAGLPQIAFAANPLPKGASMADNETPDDELAADDLAAAHGDTPVHPAASALAAASVEELTGELDRRSAEGQAVSNDGSALQEATAAAIEAEISSRGTAEESGEETEEA